MKKRCAELEKKNNEIDNELSQVKNEFNVILDINDAFSAENEVLKRRFREYESGDDFDDNFKITKKINKGKPIRNNDEPDIMDISSQEFGETNEREARVRNNNFCIFFSITNFDIYLIYIVC